MAYLIALVCLIADQLTKALAVRHLPGSPVELIPNVFRLTYVENTGAAFGMLQNNNTFFIVLMCVILAGIVIALRKYRSTSSLIPVSAGLVMGGALGNLADRIFRGFVVDFLDAAFIDFPVFNLADCCVVVGTVLFAVYLIFLEPKAGDKEPADGQA